MKVPDVESTINDEWKFFISCITDANGAPLSEIQQKEMKRAFFMGAWMFFQKTVQLHEKLKDRPQAQAAKVAQWSREMLGYIESVLERNPNV